MAEGVPALRYVSNSSKRMYLFGREDMIVQQLCSPSNCFLGHRGTEPSLFTAHFGPVSKCARQKPNMPGLGAHMT
jgi:hypothetical protein